MTVLTATATITRTDHGYGLVVQCGDDTFSAGNPTREGAIRYAQGIAQAHDYDRLEVIETET